MDLHQQQGLFLSAVRLQEHRLQSIGPVQNSDRLNTHGPESATIVRDPLATGFHIYLRA